MERSIYFDAWHRNNHCYHPSLPYRSMQMIEDLERYHATILVWAALGGGSISLPYLHHEAFGEVDPRLRFYGYLNDSEFIEECNKRGIKVMSILFEVQGWEFPIVRDENGAVKGFNVLRDPEGEFEWYGLNEFSNDEHADLFETSLKDYYPEGIYNSDGERVTQLWEEVAARDYNGTAIHAQWVEVTTPGHHQQVYQTCRNNPVWRDYMKKIMEIQIDAGTAGIQLDEAELPITSMGQGGCFCKDCVKQFRAYLIDIQAKGEVDPDWADYDFSDFHYGEYLKSNDIAFPSDKKGVPLFRHYWEFQLNNVTKYFSELVDYGKAYAKDKYDRDLLMSGNFFNGMPVYYPIVEKVDVIITEMERTVLREPSWFRYINGFARGRQTVIAENPYGGIVPEMVEQLDNGIGYDLYRLLLLEGTAYGSNFSVPYGGWMGNTIKTSFDPPRSVTTEVQDFIFKHEDLISIDSGSNLGVIYSWPSNYWRETTSENAAAQFTDTSSIIDYSPRDASLDRPRDLPFWEEIRYLSDRQYIYDVLVFGDDKLVNDDIDASVLAKYDCLILADGWDMTERQLDLLDAWVKDGGKLITIGRYGHDDEPRELEARIHVELNEQAKDQRVAFQAALDEAYERLVELDVDDLGAHLHKTADGYALHLLNYNYDASVDAVLPQDVVVKLTIEGVKEVTGYALGDASLEIESLGDGQYKIHQLPIYGVLKIDQ